MDDSSFPPLPVLARTDSIPFRQNGSLLDRDPVAVSAAKRKRTALSPITDSYPLSSSSKATVSSSLDTDFSRFNSPVDDESTDIGSRSNPVLIDGDCCVGCPSCSTVFYVDIGSAANSDLELD